MKYLVLLFGLVVCRHFRRSKALPSNFNVQQGIGDTGEEPETYSIPELPFLVPPCFEPLTSFLGISYKASSTLSEEYNADQVTFDKAGWRSAEDDEIPKFTINLSEVEPVSGFRMETFRVKALLVEFSLDAETWTPYKENGVPKIFRLNIFDQGTVVFDEQYEAQYMRFVALTRTSSGFVAFKVEIYTCVQVPPCFEPLLRFLAVIYQTSSVLSEEYNGDQVTFDKAGWRSAEDDEKPTLTLNFGEVISASGFQVQLFRVIELSVEFSLDGVSWIPYTEDGVPKTWLFDRLLNRRTVIFQEQQEFQYMKFIVVSKVPGYTALHLEVYTCVEDPPCFERLNKYLGISYQRDPIFDPNFHDGKRVTYDSSDRISVQDYQMSPLTFNFGEIVQVAGLKIQTYRLTQLAVEFSLDGRSWTPYTEDGVPKIWEICNLLNRSMVVFEAPYQTQYIRFALSRRVRSGFIGLYWKAYSCIALPPCFEPLLRFLGISYRSNSTLSEEYNADQVTFDKAGWRSAEYDERPSLTLNFGEIVQAAGFSIKTYRIKELEVQYSLDGETWFPYMEDGEPKIWQLTIIDSVTEVFEYQEVQYMKFVVVTRSGSGYTGLHIAVYGCPYGGTIA